MDFLIILQYLFEGNLRKLCMGSDLHVNQIPFVVCTMVLYQRLFCSRKLSIFVSPACCSENRMQTQK